MVFLFGSVNCQTLKNPKLMGKSPGQKTFSVPAIKYSLEASAQERRGLGFRVGRLLGVFLGFWATTRETTISLGISRPRSEVHG